MGLNSIGVFGAGVQGSLEDLILQKMAQAKQQAQIDDMRAGRDLQARGQDIDVRGQNISQETAASRLGFDREKFGEDTRQFNAQAPQREANVGYLRAQTGELIRKPKAELEQRDFTTTRDKTQHGYQMQEIGAHTAASAAKGRYNTTQGSDANGKPVMIRTNVDSGEVSVLPMPDGVNFAKRDQPATADQTNLQIYSSRIAQAEPSIAALEASVSKMNPLSFKAQEYADNPALQSKEMQQYSQASRQFVNSVLRRESGAAISQSEFDSARKQYLPMPGDDPRTLAMKAAARADVITQFQKGAGPAAQRSAHSAAPPTGGGDASASETPEQRIKRLLGGG